MAVGVLVLVLNFAGVGAVGRLVWWGDAWIMLAPFGLAALWWVIADFQPEPVHDPTRALEVGRVMFIPSERTLVEEVFSSRRRKTG